MPFSNRILVVIAIVLAIVSCKKEDVEGAAGAPGESGKAGDSILTGSVSGKVMLYDTLGYPLSDNSGVSVLLEKAGASILLNTDPEGFYSSENIAAGVYNIRFSKDGFGTMRQFNFQHTGGANGSNVGLMEMGQRLSSWSDIKRFQVDTFSFKSEPFMNMTITLTHPQVLSNPQILIYFSHVSGVTANSNDWVYPISFFQINDSTISYTSFDMPPSVFSDLLGDAEYLYLAVAINQPKMISYTDSSGLNIYPAAGRLSNEVKVYNNFKK